MYTDTYDITQHAMSKGFYAKHIKGKFDDIMRWDHQYMQVQHVYVQWVFPTKTRSLTPNSIDPLTTDEAERMTRQEIVWKNVLRSYQWFLAFMGATMVDETTGELRTSSLYDERRKKIVDHVHNYQRITRLLCWIKLMDHEGFVLPLWIFAMFHYPDDGASKSNHLH